MARKKKQKKFDVVSAVKAAARAKVGSPPPTRQEPASPKRTSVPEKHKRKLEELLTDD